MTGDEKIDQLTERVRRLELRCRRLVLVFAGLLVSMMALLIAYMHFGQSLGWNPSAHEAADYLRVRRIDFVDLDGTNTCYIYAHKRVGGRPNEIDMDIMAGDSSTKITLNAQGSKERLP